MGFKSWSILVQRYSVKLIEFKKLNENISTCNITARFSTGFTLLCGEEKLAIPTG